MKIDSREPEKIFKYFDKLKVEYSKEALPVGDFIYDDRIVIERKTVEDYINSIRSGHLSKQLCQMEQYPYAYLIISGDFKNVFFNPNVKNWTVEHTLGSLASCAVRYNVKILQVANDKQLCKLVLKLCSKTFDGKKVSLESTELMKNTLSVEGLKLKMLTCLPKVGVVRGKKLLSKYPFIKEKFEELFTFIKEKGIYKGNS